MYLFKENTQLMVHQTKILVQSGNIVQEWASSID